MASKKASQPEQPQIPEVKSAIAEVSLEAAQAAIEKDRTRRVQGFETEFQVLLKKYNCSLAPRIVFVDGQLIEAGLQLILK